MFPMLRTFRNFQSIKDGYEGEIVRRRDYGILLGDFRRKGERMIALFGDKSKPRIELATRNFPRVIAVSESSTSWHRFSLSLSVHSLFFFLPNCVYV